ncbi:MAG TPA: metallophosphoesterase [Acidobacteriota bacterium]|nr:metallophosphoesterase [Acidobacteriota bacterium]HMZ79049.1 metallophosphoesterase [Acidobacteriota bacterium]HNB73340.1 metallophosphoesterase [Acidobacteriota bacterium]HND21192.1 metallophosphoesterase [Acidobacteriota bacterium]HNG92908.1 metallophosphoesterase [Acidobacteriota bacterium]
MKRRTFLTTSLAATTGVALGGFPAILKAQSAETRITVLHTNDTHSQIEPMVAGVNVGKGGISRRMTLVKQVRQESPNTILVDGGDVCQGTPYFNFYRGEVEYKAMSMMGYTAGTLGNHEFDNGVGPLTKALSFANFPIVNANYDFSGTPKLRARVKPFIVRTFGGIRVGIFGLGVNFKNLVLPDNHKGITYRDPIEVSRRVVKQLREREGCDFVLALSHLGYPKDNIGTNLLMHDIMVAEQVDGIDFIVGGHTHMWMDEPDVITRPGGGRTLLFQAGYAGVRIGRVDFFFRDRKLAAWNGKPNEE